MGTGYIIGLIIGTVVGMIVTFIFCRINNKVVGTLRVDQSDPDDEPYLFLELNSSIDAVRKREYVTLKVNTENYISQK